MMTKGLQTDWSNVDHKLFFNINQQLMQESESSTQDLIVKYLSI